MDRQSSEAAFSSCEAERLLIVRLVGTTPRADAATKKNIAQLARVTHVATPPLPPMAHTIL